MRKKTLVEKKYLKQKWNIEGCNYVLLLTFNWYDHDLFSSHPLTWMVSCRCGIFWLYETFSNQRTSWVSYQLSMFGDIRKPTVSFPKQTTRMDLDRLTLFFDNSWNSLLCFQICYTSRRIQHCMRFISAWACHPHRWLAPNMTRNSHRPPGVLSFDYWNSWIWLLHRTLQEEWLCKRWSVSSPFRGYLAIAFLENNANICGRWIAFPCELTIVKQLEPTDFLSTHNDI